MEQLKEFKNPDFQKLDYKTKKKLSDKYFDDIYGNNNLYTKQSDENKQKIKNAFVNSQIDFSVADKAEQVKDYFSDKNLADVIPGAKEFRDKQIAARQEQKNQTVEPTENQKQNTPPSELDKTLNAAVHNPDGTLVTNSLPVNDPLHQMPQTKEEAIQKADEAKKFFEDYHKKKTLQNQDLPLEDESLYFAFPGAGATRATQGAIAKTVAKTTADKLAAEKMIAGGKAFAKGDIVGNVAAQGAMGATDEALSEDFKKEYPLTAGLIELGAGLAAGGFAGIKAENKVMQKYQTLADNVKNGKVSLDDAEKSLKQDTGFMQEYKKVNKLQADKKAEDEAYKALSPEEKTVQNQTADEFLKATKPKKVSEGSPVTSHVDDNGQVILDIKKSEPKQDTELDQIDNGWKELDTELHGENGVIKDDIKPKGVKEDIPLSQQLLNTQSEINDSLRKADFEESVDNLAGAKAHKENADALTQKAQDLEAQIKLQEEAKPVIEKPRIGEPEPEAVTKRDVVPESINTPKANEPKYTQQDYAKAYDALPTDKKTVAGTQNSLDLAGTQNALFDTTAKEEHITPSWAKPLVNDTTRYEDVIRAVTDAKNGKPTPLADRAVAAIQKDEILQHPRLNELLDMRKDVLAKDIQSPNKLVSKGAGRELDGYNGTDKNTYDKAQYERNYAYDFELTKNDVKKIKEGKVDDEVAGKLEHDLGVLDNHPDYAPVESTPTKEMSKSDWDEANSVFSKGLDNVAVAAYAGVDKDENGNYTLNPEKFLLGLGGYSAVKMALKNKLVQGKLKEYAQKAIDTVDMNPAVYKENGLNAMSPVKSKTQKEKRGIYNVQNNDKKSTNIYKDDEFADNYIKYEQGKADYVDENGKTKNGFGALHINKHIGNDKNGWVTQNELLNIGNAIRNTKPVVSKQGRRMYEYHNNDNVRFRVVVGDKKNGERTISFYSNRKAGFDNDSQNYIYNQPVEEKKGYEIPLITDNSSSDKAIIPQKEEKAALHANAGHTLAGAFAGGADSEINQRDYNGDGVHDFKDVLLGAGTGAVGINALKKVKPTWFEDGFVRGEKGTKIGAFAGDGVTVSNKAQKAFNKGELKGAESLPDETKLQLIQRKMQDKFNRVKQLINHKASMETIDDAMNPYQKEELMHGKVEAKLTDFETQTVTPIIEKIAKAKLTTEKIDEYLWARHAPERNKAMFELHQVENGSGMSDEEAYKIINKYKDNKAMNEIVQDVCAMNRSRLKLIQKEGLESDDFIQKLEGLYDNYVPLRREFGTADKAVNVGKGFDVKGHETKKARGSDRAVESPLMHSILAYEETIVRAGKNEVGKSFLNFTKEFPDESLYTITDLKHKAVYDKNGAVVNVDALYKKDDNVLHVKVDGKIKEITIHDPALASAFKNLNSAQMGALLKASHKAIRLIASVNTMYNPEFVISNFERDIQTAIINMPDNIKGNRLNILKDVGFAMRGIYNHSVKGKDNEWGKLFKELKHEGGTTGWHDMYSVQDIAKSTKTMIDKYNGKIMPKEAAKKVLGYIDDVNDAVENSTRLVAYKMAKESGLSNEKSASIAKNLTVNFNRSGEMSPTLNSLYMFYNASVQGTSRMMIQLKNSHKAQAIVGGIAGGAIGLDMYNRSVNEDAYKLIPDYIKDTNYIFMNKDGSYETMQLPYGYNMFKSIGDIAAEAYHGEIELKDIPTRILKTSVNAFSPIGVDSDSLIHTVLPTLAKPVYEVEQNRNFFGGNIRPEDNPFAPEKPDSQKYFKSVNPVAKSIAKGLNEKTGGNMVQKGMIDISPETIEYMVGFATGGLGRLITNAYTTGSQAYKGEKVDKNKIPFSRKFYHVPREKEEVNLVYKLAKKSGDNLLSDRERKRFYKWAKVASDKKDLTQEQYKKLANRFKENQALQDFAKKYNLQDPKDYTKDIQRDSYKTLTRGQILRILREKEKER